MRCRMTPARAWRQVPLHPRMSRVAEGRHNTDADASARTTTTSARAHSARKHARANAQVCAQTRAQNHTVLPCTRRRARARTHACSHRHMHSTQARTHTHTHTRARAPARAFERANHTRAQTPARAETKAPALTHNTQRAHMVARARASDMLTTASQEPADEQSNTDAKLYKQSGPVSCQTLRHCTVLYVVYK